MNMITEWAKERLVAFAFWVAEPTKTKSTMLGLSGFSLWKFWEATKPVLSGIALACTAIIMLIHAINLVVNQWCPMRRQKAQDCGNCPLRGSILCCKGTSKSE